MPTEVDETHDEAEMHRREQATGEDQMMEELLNEMGNQDATQKDD